MQTKHSPLMERLGNYLDHRLVLTGIALGFLAAVAAGHWAGRQNIYADRERFFFKIAPEGSVYPSLDHLCNWVRARAPRDKTLVIVGGSSVLLGVGQPEKQLWSTLLQQYLGDKYSVVNLSSRGGRATEAGAIVGEALRDEYASMWLVVDQVPFENLPKWFEFRRPQAVYLTCEALASGQLRRIEARDAEWRADLNSPDPKIRHAAQEELLKGGVHAWTGANDLWGFVHYRLGFTLFSPLDYPPRTFWHPRYTLEDDEGSSESRLKTHLENPRELDIFRGKYLKKMEWDSEGKPRVRETFRNLEQSRRKLMDEIAMPTLCVTLNPPPSFVHLMTLDEQKLCEALLIENERMLKEAGINSVTVRTLDDNDYSDLVHLSGKASEKVASAVANAILKKDLETTATEKQR